MMMTAVFRWLAAIECLLNDLMRVASNCFDSLVVVFTRCVQCAVDG
jgi:hypothetical protein